MASITLHIQDHTQRITLKALLEVEEHTVTENMETQSQVQFCDLQSWHKLAPTIVPTVLLATAAEIPSAVDAMNAGAWGYIFVPFQPCEACVAVSHEINNRNTSSPIPNLSNLPTMESVEFEHIALTLRLCNGNQAKAARLLNIGRNTLWRKLKKMEKQKDND